MTIARGTHSIGPQDGTVAIHTYRAGMGAKVGHDLVLQATRWSGSVDLDPDNPSASAVDVTIDARSFQVVSGTGGVKPLSDKDRADICKNIDEKILHTAKFPEITFRSTEVVGAPPQLTVHGELAIHGQTRPVTLDVAVEDGGGGARARATTTIVQSDFGIKPFTAMLGALKVRDDVGLDIDVGLPTA